MWHPKRLILWISVLIVIIQSAPAFAQEDLFFHGSVIEELDEGQGTALDRDLLMGDILELGADLGLDLSTSLIWTDTRSQISGADLKSNLSLDARPSRDLRLFAKGLLTISTSSGQDEPISSEFRVTELFVDSNIGDRVFFRAGKQTVNWGVGYFMSPADIINIARIDPQNPEAQREGPLSLKANVPAGSHNLYLYIISDGSLSREGLALAPKAEFVLGKSEVGVGGFLKKDCAPRAMVTLSTSLGKTAVFGEGVLSYGSDKRFIVYDPESPFGIAVVDRDDEFFVQGTLGFRHTFRDEEGHFNLSLAGQYLYNGEGYDDAKIISQNPIAIGFFLNEGSLSHADLASPGKHYVAASASWAKMFRSDVSTTAFWLGNLSDGSGMANLSASWSPSTYVTGSIGLTKTYGGSGTEYARYGESVAAYARLSLKTQGFYWRVAR